MTLWIGLTGGIGSGKSQAAKIFSDLGVPHIDADALSRNLTADNGIALPAIRRLFGDKVFHTQNSLNRAALRDLVFRRPQAKKELEEVLLPLILNEIKSAKTRYPNAAYGIIDVPLLIEIFHVRAMMYQISSCRNIPDKTYASPEFFGSIQIKSLHFLRHHLHRAAAFCGWPECS